MVYKFYSTRTVVMVYKFHSTRTGIMVYKYSTVPELLSWSKNIPHYQNCCHGLQILQYQNWHHGLQIFHSTRAVVMVYKFHSTRTVVMVYKYSTVPELLSWSTISTVPELLSWSTNIPQYQNCRQVHIQTATCRQKAAIQYVQFLIENNNHQNLCSKVKFTENSLWRMLVHALRVEKLHTLELVT